MVSQEAILIAEQQLLKALEKGDLSQLDVLLHEDLLFNLPTGHTINKEQDMEAYRSGKMIIDVINASNHQINLIEDSAIVTALIKMKGQYCGDHFDSTFKIIRVWKLFKDQWKVIGGSSIAFMEDQ